VSPGPRLRLATGPLAGKTVDVEGELVIGREGADLVISDPELSRRHAVVRGGTDGIVLEDLGSTNGTFVEGRRITTRVNLQAQGVFRVGKTEIVVEVGAPAGATRLHEAPEPGATRVAARPPAPMPPPEAVSAPVPPPPAPPAPPPAAPVESPAPSVPAAARGASPLAALPRWLPLTLLGLLLAVVLIVLLASGGDDEAETRRVTAAVRAAALTSEPTRTIFSGVQSGAPTGLGSASLDITRSRSLRGAGNTPVAITGKFVGRFDNGSIQGTLRGTVTPRPDSSLSYAGTISVTSGKADFEGATGRLTLRGTQAGGAPRADFTLRGSLRY
jgi:pSer/pThr/pTyr-binding forkhead associated (FHA) protein